MDLSFLKNPIVLSIIAACLTYAYLYWENKKKKEENPKAELEEISFTTPAIIGILTLFVSYNIFGHNTLTDTKDTVGTIINQSKPNLLEGGSKLIDGTNKLKLSDKWTETLDSNTYHLIGKNAIRLPQTDVFIDLAKF